MRERDCWSKIIALWLSVSQWYLGGPIHLLARIRTWWKCASTSTSSTHAPLSEYEICSGMATPTQTEGDQDFMTGPPCHRGGVMQRAYWPLPSGAFQITAPTTR